MARDAGGDEGGFAALPVQLEGVVDGPEVVGEGQAGDEDERRQEPDELLGRFLSGGDAGWVCGFWG
ncbi:MAG: hypothetical protein D6781_06050 [Verrucomicrobia bacterium]|nr:MAG: hypothetical protein D6781_06050 [Verrucomicrobiota bacterium]